MPRDELQTREDDPARAQTPDAGDALVGRCLDGKFVLRQLVGRGASSRVYRADQVALDRIVAVKVFGPVARGDTTARRFHAEAYAASRLRHPNVVSIYDHGQTADGLLYIAMELVTGRTLRELLADEFPLAPNRVVDLMVQILDALEDAHAAGVIHADLKADNIIVEPLRGGGDRAKVIDFGIARLAHVTVDAPAQPAVREAPRRIAAQVTGTPEYMAPEVICGSAPTKATDIYSAGVVLYELLTGVLPFPGDSVPVVLARHLEDELEPIAPRFPELSIPPALEGAVTRAMAKDPAQRFPDAASFRDQVRAGREDASASAVCAICGARYGARFRYCSECGVRLSVDAAAGDDARRDVQQAKRRGQQAFERGDTTGGVEGLRGAVGMAIRLGDVDVMADCYHALARVLSTAGAVDAAVLELEEALALLTAGDASGTGPRELWRLLVLLAELYHRRRQDRASLHTASRALAAARRVSSSHGRRAAEELLSRLYARARRDARGSPAAGESIAQPEPEQAVLLALDEDTEPWETAPDPGAGGSRPGG